MKPLFVYGTLCPVAAMRIFWRRSGAVASRLRHRHLLRARGWGAAADFRGSSSTLTAHGSTAICSCPIGWRRTGPCWTTLRRGHDRVPVEVTTDDGQRISARFISFSPGVIPAGCAAWYSSPARSRVWRRFCQCRYTCRCFLSFRHADDKTHLTRADAQSRPGQQQKWLKSRERRKIPRSGP